MPDKRDIELCGSPVRRGGSTVGPCVLRKGHDYGCVPQAEWDAAQKSPQKPDKRDFVARVLDSGGLAVRRAGKRGAGGGEDFTSEEAAIIRAVLGPAPEPSGFDAWLAELPKSSAWHGIEVDEPLARLAYTAGAAETAARVGRLEECLLKLSNESQGFLAMAQPHVHGTTNMRVLADRIKQARELLGVPDGK
jgi:hypothetical protein